MVNCLRTCRRTPRPRRSKRVFMISLHSPNEQVRVQRRPVHAFTVDLEDYYHIHAYSRVISKESWAAYPARVEDGLNRVLGMLDEFGVRATIFVLGWLAERKKRLVRQCRNLGHEIACHGFDHQAIYLNGPSHFREDIRRSKSLLEDIIGAPVLGFRAPTYSITPKTMWALRIIAEEGFVYDSSLVSIRHDYYGFPAREKNRSCSDWGIPRSGCETKCSAARPHAPKGMGMDFLLLNFPYEPHASGAYEFRFAEADTFDFGRIP